MADEILQIVCVHRNLESDLMLWDSLVRSVSSAAGRYILVVGAGERIVRMMGGLDERPVQPSHELTLHTVDHQRVYEREMREEGKKIISKFSDMGKASVGFVGADHGMLKRDKYGVLVVSRIIELADLTSSGVVPVLMAMGKNASGTVIDVDPFVTVFKLSEKLNENGYKIMIHNVILLASVTDTMKRSVDEEREISKADASILTRQLPSLTYLSGSETPSEIRFLTPSKLGHSFGAIWVP